MVLSATLFPPMLAPVMTVAPFSRVMDTGVKVFPLPSTASAIWGLTMSVISRVFSVKTGMVPP